MRRRLVASAVLTAVAACGVGADPYPLPSGPPNFSQHNPAAVGEPIRAVLIYLEVRPGDRIDLIGADAVGTLDGAAVRFLVSFPVIDADGDHVVGSDFEDLAGAVVTPAAASPGPDNTVGIAAELTAQRPGRFQITNVRLRYRLNGGGDQVGEGIDVVWTVCADDPAPADCPEQATHGFPSRPPNGATSSQAPALAPCSRPHAINAGPIGLTDRFSKGLKSVRACLP